MKFNSQHRKDLRSMGITGRELRHKREDDKFTATLYVGLTIVFFAIIIVSIIK